MSKFYNKQLVNLRVFISVLMFANLGHR